MSASKASEASLPVLALTLPRIVFGTPPGPHRNIDLSAGNYDDAAQRIANAITHILYYAIADFRQGADSLAPGTSIDGPLDKAGTSMSIEMPVWNGSAIPDPGSGAMPARSLIANFRLRRFAVRVPRQSPAFMRDAGSDPLTWLRADGSNLGSVAYNSDTWESRAAGIILDALATDYLQNGRSGHSVDLPVL